MHTGKRQRRLGLLLARQDKTITIASLEVPGGLRPSLVVWLLGLTQIIGYGTLYYSFAILAGDAAKDFGWSVSALFASLSVGLLAGGVIAHEVGKRIDRHGAGVVMAVGSVLSAAALLLVSLAPNGPIFAIAIVATQIISSLVLYDAAFAALVQATGVEARLRITHLTLIAGFASTIFWPMTSWLHGIVGWREIYAGFAALNLFVCLPLHALLIGQTHHHAAVAREVQASTKAPAARPSRYLLWMVTAAFALSGFALSAVLSQMVPMLTALGIGGSAVLVSALFGPAQVLVRFVNMLVGNRRHPVFAALIALALVPAALGVLAWSAPLAIGAVVFALMVGFGSGLKSVVQGTLPLALFGSSGYGARLGFMAAFRQGLAALAPFALALLIDGVGAPLAVAGITLVGVLGFAAMVAVAFAHAALERDGQRAADSAKPAPK